MMRTMGFNNKSGFTLMELLLTMGLLSLVAVLAIPAMLSFLPDYRLKEAAGDVVANLQKARSEAVKQNRSCNLTFNLTIDGKSYDYVAWMDGDGDGVFDAGESLFAVSFADFPGVFFDNAMGGGDGLTFVGDTFSFNPRGLCEIAVSAGETTASIYLTNSKGKRKRIMVGLAGAVKLES